MDSVFNKLSVVVALLSQWIGMRLLVSCRKTLSGLIAVVSGLLSDLLLCLPSSGRCYSVVPPSLISIYLFNLKQTKLFAFINN